MVGYLRKPLVQYLLFLKLWLPIFMALGMIFLSISMALKEALCHVPHSGSVPPSGCFGPIWIHCILHNKWDSILTTTSGPLRLPWDSLPVLFRVFYCSVIGTSRFLTAQTTLLCGVLSAWSSLCLMSTGQTCTPPHPHPGQCPVCVWLKYPSGLFSTVEFWNYFYIPFLLVHGFILHGCDW